MEFRPLDTADEMRDASRIASGFNWATRSARLWAFLVIVFILATDSSHPAEQPQFSENQVKGAFLTKFAMFVEWPGKPAPGGQTPILIGILGDDPFGPQFEAALAKGTVNGRPLVLKRLKEPQEAAGCQILFVCPSENPRLPEILAATRKQPILTVGDQE